MKITKSSVYLASRTWLEGCRLSNQETELTFWLP